MTCISLKCSKCEYERELALGVIMQECDCPEEIFGGENPQLLEIIKNDKIANKALELIKNGGVPSRNYDREIYYCSVCNEFHNHFHFAIEKDNKTFEPDYDCSICGCRLIIVKLAHDNYKLYLQDSNQKRIDWHCPNCGNDDLECGDTLMVD